MPVKKIIVRDMPVRLVHWGMAALVVALYITAKTGNMEMHALWGKVMLALVFYRVCWGFVGGETALFRSFDWMPSTIWRNVRGRGVSLGRGHTVFGGWPVLAILAVVALEAIAGLFSCDNALFYGPLVKYAGYAASGLATHLHRLGFYWVVLPVIGLHVASILFYRFVKKRDLLGPMIGGDIEALGEDETEPKAAEPGRAMTFAMGAFVFWICLNRL